MGSNLKNWYSWAIFKVIKSVFNVSKTVATIRYRNIGSFRNSGRLNIVITAEFPMIATTVTVIEDTRYRVFRESTPLKVSLLKVSFIFEI